MYWPLLFVSKDASASITDNYMTCMGTKTYFSFQKLEYKVLGAYVALSIVQGKFGFPVLAPHAYDYICSENNNLVVEDADVPCTQARALIKQVRRTIKHTKSKWAKLCCLQLKSISVKVR